MKLSKREGLDCPICFETFQEQADKGEEVEIVQLKCSKFHIFHYECLKSLIESNLDKRDKCPFCNVPIEVQDPPILEWNELLY